jgi:hypothetical protein
MIESNEGQGAGFPTEQSEVDTEGPTEKLQPERVTDSLVPGAQNPENEEIKGELNPNTE